MHLISSYRFPTLPGLQAPQALEYLIKGPQIVRDTSPVAWTFLSAPPQDGTVILTWQPPRMGTMFASDGMVWADAETAYDMNVRGYVCISGYHCRFNDLIPHRLSKSLSTTVATTTLTNHTRCMRAIVIESPQALVPSIPTSGLSTTNPPIHKAECLPHKYPFHERSRPSYRCALNYSRLDH